MPDHSLYAVELDPSKMIRGVKALRQARAMLGVETRLADAATEFAEGTERGHFLIGESDDRDLLDEVREKFDAEADGAAVGMIDPDEDDLAVQPTYPIATSMTDGEEEAEEGFSASEYESAMYCLMLGAGNPVLAAVHARNLANVTEDGDYWAAVIGAIISAFPYCVQGLREQGIVQ